MKHWLLVAEADKIQDFLFRSSRLAQVAGGSGLLARFCDEMPQLLDVPPENRIIHGGGSFRLRFDTEREAVEAGELLAQTYYRAAGGSLTVIDPIEYEEGQYLAASQTGQTLLRLAKHARKGASAVLGLPQMAVCASCGHAPAEDHLSRFRDERANYLCGPCASKAAERSLSWRTPSKERFLNRFLAELHRRGCRVPLGLREEKDDESPRQLAKDASQIGAFDRRGYVAYVLADGNGMGVLFGKCRTESEAHALSETLDEAMWAAFSQVSADLHRTLWQDRSDMLIPALPLIVGGDDLFALIAAPCALDFVRRLCGAFEEEMRQGLSKPDLRSISGSPTLSASVVICKASYPYNLAHRHGERLLTDAKRLAKSRQPAVSSVDFEVILGSDWEGAQTDAKSRFCPSFRPYYALAPTDDKRLCIDALLHQRKKLDEILPGKRRAELRRLFQGVPRDGGAETERWNRKLGNILARIGKDESLLPKVKEALEELGSAHPSAPGDLDFWRSLTDPDGSYRCRQGMPDLLEAWHFLGCLDEEAAFQSEGQDK